MSDPATVEAFRSEAERLDLDTAYDLLDELAGIGEATTHELLAELILGAVPGLLTALDLIAPHAS